MDKDFLLQNDTACRLYNNYAEQVPIIDYHCHISPSDIANDRHFANITQIWLGADHYKWRFMRSCGIDERYITGCADDKEKFFKWAWCLDKAIGNPLYHWTHLELRRYFDYTGVLNIDSADKVWTLCNEKLNSPSMSAKNIIKYSNVSLICTTDDPVASLEYHKKIADDNSFNVQVLPAWRPDKVLNISSPDYIEYIKLLSDSSGVSINTFSDLQTALIKRLNFFNSMGCCISDHGLEYVMYKPVPIEKLDEIFVKRMHGSTITREEDLQFKTGLMLFLGKEYNRLGWVMQLHFGCKRNNNTLRYNQLGPDTGYDCINNYFPAAQLTDFLNELAFTDSLPKTILYSLNPNDNQAIGTIIGCFQDSSACSKIQQGSAWWFNDNKTGMEEQLISLANLGNLSGFAGMLTDSRSFLSYTRHEYFRRILCNLIGGWVENGEFPCDMDNLEKIIKGICYNNAIKYFGFKLDPV